MIRSPISYPGGKWKALPMILPLIPDGIEDWREPFFGGGSVTLGFLQNPKSRNLKRAIVGDLSTEIYALWQGIKMHPEDVVQIVKQWMNERVPLKMSLDNRALGDYTEEEYEKAIAEGKELWDFLKKVDCNKLSLPERAARTFIINRISFSGMGDSGSISKDNFMKFNLGHTKRITDVAPLLQKVEIINESFEVTMADTNKDKSFIFLDPPYIAQEKSGLYGKDGDTHFGFPHKELAQLCRNTECKWLMTIDDSPQARRLYRGFNIETFKLTYTMALNSSDDALDGEEIFVANYGIKEETSYDLLDSIL